MAQKVVLRNYRVNPAPQGEILMIIQCEEMRAIENFPVHLGEAAAITLTAELDEALLIIDDSSGRRIAAALGLRYTGTVGLLVASKQARHIARIAPLLEDLRLRARFWISDDVISRALQLAGE